MASQKCIICVFQFIYFYFMSNVVNRVLLHYHEILIQKKKNIHKRLEVFHLSFFVRFLFFVLTGRQNIFFFIVYQNVVERKSVNLIQLNIVQKLYFL